MNSELFIKKKKEKRAVLAIASEDKPATTHLGLETNLLFESQTFNPITSLYYVQLVYFLSFQ